MTRFDLLSWGANSHHQLGQGVESEQCLSPLAVNLNGVLGSTDNEIEIKKVTGGAGHSLILDVNGNVYSCGWNAKGQTGIPGSQNYLSKFELIDKLKDFVIVDVACGWDSSMAIDNHGNLYVWGSNAYGQLGIRSSKIGTKAIVESPEKVDLQDFQSEPIRKVSMGLRHSAIVTISGKLLVAGNGNKCQLGVIDSSNKPVRKIHTFTQVHDLSGIKSVTCGQHHTMVQTNQGNLYAWGDNRHGQLGFDPIAYPSIASPSKLENINIGLNAEIFTGWTHSAVLHDGKIIAWGRNTYGQLGRAESNKFQRNWIPELVQKGECKFMQVAVGSEHNVALTENGSVITWGWNEHGNCGNGTEEDVRLPVPIEMPKPGRVQLVGTGAGHSFAVVKYREDRGNR